VTDPAAQDRNDPLQPLKDVIRASVHETRNALNGVVVNLEVVRSRLVQRASRAQAATPEPEVLSFAEQAVMEAEGAVRLNEGVGALLSLVTASFAAGGVQCSSVAKGTSIRFDVDTATAERVLPLLDPLGKAAGFLAERHDGAVIFTIPNVRRPESHKYE
jgi:hypothetical protein